MTSSEWDAIEVGRLVRTTRKLLVVGSVGQLNGKTRVQLHWVQVMGAQYRVSVDSYGTADSQHYDLGDLIPRDALFTDGTRFWGNSGVADMPKRSLLRKGSRGRSFWNRVAAAWQAARAEWVRE